MHSCGPPPASTGGRGDSLCNICVAVSASYALTFTNQALVRRCT